MAQAFTWFAKFGDVLDALPEEAQAEFALAVVRYGSLGEEPEFSTPMLAALFLAVREDVDNSLSKRAAGNRGGRPPKKGKPQVETTVRENAETGYEVSETTGAQDAEPGFGDAETSSYINQSKPVQASTVQSSAGEGWRAPEPVPLPTEDEVEAYFAATPGLRGDPHAFFDHFAAQGWRRGNGMPVEDWRRQARMWGRKQAEIDAEARARGKPTASEAEGASWRPAETPEQRADRLEREYVERYGEVPR